MTPRQTRSQSRPQITWTILGLFAMLVALLGGSSRPDAVQIVALRPLAALFVFPAIYFFTWSYFRDVRTPFLLLVGLTALIALQLVPLPPDLWHALPGRGPLVDLDMGVGMADIWRPLSMVPSRTLNTFAAMIVPMTGFVLIASLRADRRTLLYVVVAIGSASAVIGLIQLAGGEVFYFYEFTNRGSPTGLFANRNHAATLHAMTLVTIAYLASAPDLASRSPSHGILLGMLFALVLLTLLLSGSRAGLVALLLALGASATFAWVRHVRHYHQQRRRNAQKVHAALGRWLALAFCIAGVAGILALFFLFDRIPALDRLAQQGAADSMRSDLTPILFEMIKKYGLVGSGFGSFEEVYHISEPTALMVPHYINQAHNDWAQWVIEGGLPAVAIAVAFLAWFASAVRAIFRRRYGFARGIHWASLAAILLSASLVDYPLRTPLFQFVAVLLLAALCREKRRARDGY